MVELKPEVGGDEIKVELNDRKDGTYSAEYTVDMLCGKLTLSVCLRGAHIKGSPFAVNVTQPQLHQPASASTASHYRCTYSVAWQSPQTKKLKLLADPYYKPPLPQPASASTASNYQLKRQSDLFSRWRNVHK